MKWMDWMAKGRRRRASSTCQSNRDIIWRGKKGRRPSNFPAFAQHEPAAAAEWDKRWGKNRRSDVKPSRFSVVRVVICNSFHPFLQYQFIMFRFTIVIFLSLEPYFSETTKKLRAITNNEFSYQKVEPRMGVRRRRLSRATRAKTLVMYLRTYALYLRLGMDIRTFVMLAKKYIYIPEKSRWQNPVMWRKKEKLCFLPK